ncbi:hypothetical protein [Streptomyces sp. NPDC001508]|uniref:hypothetical protein n=1 Tax=Streptomyces sp. NPDC001508 TaxID=3154656 RepID=UPI00332541D4
MRYRGAVTVRGAGDARLELPGWTSGFVWIDGLGLGRYGAAGPRRALYVPRAGAAGGRERGVGAGTPGDRPGTGRAAPAPRMTRSSRPPPVTRPSRACRACDRAGAAAGAGDRRKPLTPA